MGWLFQNGITRKDLIAERTKDWTREDAEGMTVTTACLAHCYRGGAFSGVLWAVWERTFSRNGQSVQPLERWIMCDLLRYQLGCRGYKDLDEAMFPYFFPLGYLDMVPIETYGGHQEW
ncbi:MAG: hypothetical protein ACYC0X_19950 [Pirellulaceae bacterium]